MILEQSRLKILLSLPSTISRTNQRSPNHQNRQQPPPNPPTNPPHTPRKPNHRRRPSRARRIPPRSRTRTPTPITPSNATHPLTKHIPQRDNNLHILLPTIPPLARTHTLQKASPRTNTAAIAQTPAARVRERDLLTALRAERVGFHAGDVLARDGGERGGGRGGDGGGDGGSGDGVVGVEAAAEGVGEGLRAVVVARRAAYGFAGGGQGAEEGAAVAVQVVVAAGLGRGVRGGGLGGIGGEWCRGREGGGLR